MTSVEDLAGQCNIQAVRKDAEKLNAACPVARVNPGFSPERIANLLDKDPPGLIRSPLVWECLTCHLCREITRGQVDMSRFVRDVRQMAVKAGFRGTETHGGILITAQRLNARTGLKPSRTDWIAPPLRVRSKGVEYLYWVGGAPFFAAVMPDLRPTPLDSARAAIGLLNRVGIEPIVLEDERFSGHDLLWTGEAELFRTLAEQNLQAIKRSGAKVVIVSSPEDYYTLAESYGEYCGGLDFEVFHITEILASRLSGLEFGEWQERVTYHDPCRLGRGMGVYEPPRQILSAVPGLELVEMENTREFSLCCGTSCWTNCRGYSKLIQVNRLREAAAAGAQSLVTTCWECILHFRCATRPEAWRQVFVEVKDLLGLLASRLH
ncbi:MAG: (Fe-S)-binding protein [Deltaproteobacteria bacterium]|nr:(Fe-S)-binding protein [Deltaproteobacteria bacterium]